ncbi:MAG: cell division protein CrgA [Actinobacteria bacterium]|nr:cell division protein CrgA [Actinomycetota bacterium]
MAGGTKSGPRRSARSSRARQRGPGRAGGGPGGGTRAVDPGIQSGRYTPPIPKSVRRSPPWVLAVILGLLVVGFAMVILNYVGVLPGGASNWYLIGGLVLLAAGGMIATRYH